MPTEPNQHIIDEAFWSILSKPLPELPALVVAIASICPDERCETTLDSFGRELVRTNETCTELFVIQGHLYTRLTHIRNSQPMTVLAAAMRACPMHGAKPAEMELWNNACDALDRVADTLISTVSAYERTGMRRP
jgi:hypothetical protein